MCYTGTELDTTFVVENLKFTVHSHILAASSDVFQVMLHSPEWSAEEVQIEDVKSLTFWLLLLVRKVNVWSTFVKLSACFSNKCQKIVVFC